MKHNLATEAESDAPIHAEQSKKNKAEYYLSARRTSAIGLCESAQPSKEKSKTKGLPLARHNTTHLDRGGAVKALAEEHGLDVVGEGGLVEALHRLGHVAAHARHGVLAAESLNLVCKGQNMERV